MKKLVIALIVLSLMVLSFKVGEQTHTVTRSMQDSSVKPSVAEPHLSTDKETDAIANTLFQQADAWNTGDIDAFMMDYWRSDSLRFASGGTVKYGWQTTLDRYKERYPTDAAMGELAFTDLDIKILSATDALVFGRWKLTRQADTPNGLFTLHMRKVSNDWVIVSDHTSSSD